MWVIKWTIRSADAFIYFSWEGKSGKSTQFDWFNCWDSGAGGRGESGALAGFDREPVGEPGELTHPTTLTAQV